MKFQRFKFTPLDNRKLPALRNRKKIARGYGTKSDSPGPWRRATPPGASRSADYLPGPPRELGETSLALTSQS